MNEVKSKMIHWCGNQPCPVKDGVRIEIVTRDCKVKEGIAPLVSKEDWTHTVSASDVVRYRELKSVPVESTVCRVVNDNEGVTAVDLLKIAGDHMSDRAATYDTEEGERSVGKTVAAFNTITGHNLKESEGWLLLQVLKDVRQWSNDDYHPDSAEDSVAYCALKGEALSKGL